MQGYGAEARCSPLDSKQWAIDFGKALCTIALRNAYTEHEVDDGLAFMTPPLHIKAEASYAKGSLQLYPASMCLTLKPPSSSYPLCLGEFDVGPEPFKLYLASHTTLLLSKDSTPNENPWIAPFWIVWATQSDNKKPANMELKWEKTKVVDSYVQVPYLKNLCKINVGDIIAFDKASLEEPQKKKAKTNKTN